MAISRDGKICYIEMPAHDVQRSAAFYERVFGWKIRRRGDGSVSFDDTVEVSGSFVTGRKPAAPGLMVHIMVASVAKTCEAIIASGGEIVQPMDAGAPEITATFRDPAGNVLGLYQERSLSAAGG